MKLLNILTLSSLIFLGACASAPPPEVITTQVHTRIDVPASLYNCSIPKLPDSATLTDISVAKFIATQHADLKTCKNNINSIKKFIDNVNTIIGKTT